MLVEGHGYFSRLAVLVEGRDGWRGFERPDEVPNGRHRRASENRRGARGTTDGRRDLAIIERLGNN